MIRKKPAPHLMRGRYRFSEKNHAQTKKIERDDVSKKSHRAPASERPARTSRSVLRSAGALGYRQNAADLLPDHCRVRWLAEANKQNPRRTDREVGEEQIWEVTH